MAAKKQVHLALLGLAPGAHQAAWRHPNCNPRGHMDLDFFRHLVKTAERGKFDLLFIADVMGPLGADHTHPDMFQRQPYGLLDPVVLLTALATCTTHLGLVGTQSATVYGPYQTARSFGSLDLVSGGRAGWNLITTPLQSQQDLARTPLVGKEELYAHAREVAECVFEFWDSWAEDSFPRDRDACRFVSLDKANIPSHEGKYYRLSAPLNQPRSPQGRPIVVQAGSSDIGRGLGAHVADIAFTVQPTLAASQAFYKDMKQRAAADGRDPDTLLVMPGLCPYVGRTRQEAQDLKDRMLECIDWQASIGEIRYISNIDLSGHDLDGPIPDVEPWRDARNTGFFNAIKKIRAENPEMTVRGLLKHMSGGRGHPETVGSAQDVADWIEQWVEEEAADGILIQPPLLPDDLERFVDLVIPELQRRGRFRLDYEHTTLRGNLGLPPLTR